MPGCLSVMKLFCVTHLFFIAPLYGQTIPLSSSRDLDPVNVNIEEVTYKDKRAVRITAIREDDDETIAIVRGLEFKNGTIEIEVSGKLIEGAGPDARGFVGIAFRVQRSDTLRYECFYIRPTNGRSEDQLRRNHSTQYVSHPDFPWHRLRKEQPGVYESYVDLVPGEWTKLKIVVKDREAKLYVHDAQQPCLIVKDLKRGIINGAIALWIGPGTDGHFSNLRITTDR